MDCRATLTGTVNNNTVSATVDAVVTDNQITFTVTNNTPGTLIDELYFSLDSSFIVGLMEGAGTRANWDLQTRPNGVPGSCQPEEGDFLYKFFTNTPGARISSLEPGTLVLNAPVGVTFPEDILTGEDVCVHVQQVGPGGGLSVCACGVFNCPPVTTTTTTQPPVTTTTTTQPPVTTTTTTQPPVTTTTTTEPPVTTTTTEPPVTTTTTEPPVTTTTTEPPVTTTTTEPPVTTTTTEPPVTTMAPTEPPVTTTTTQAPPVTTTTRKPKKDCPLVEPVADMEAALVQVLLLFVQSGNLDAIERIFRLIIKKEILLEMLLDECPRDHD